MGAANSKVEDDKALSLCRERKRFVKRAIQERCLLAEAHLAYLRSLKSTGTALRKFSELEIQVQHSLYVSTSATHEPLRQTNKSTSQISNMSLSPSLVSSEQIHVNYMKVAQNISTTIKEKPPASLIATMHSSSTADRPLRAQSDENSSIGSLSTQLDSRPWDYFDPLHPLDNEFSFDNENDMNHEFNNAEGINRLRNEAHIPEGNDIESEDDFDEASNEPIVRMFKNRNAPSPEQMRNKFRGTTDTSPKGGEKNKASNIIQEFDEIHEMIPLRGATSAVSFPNGSGTETGEEVKQGTKDFFSSMKEIEILFVKASEAGKEVSSILEANDVQFRSSFPEEQLDQTPSRPTLLTTCLACFGNEVPQLHADATSEKSEIKYLTWHNTVSSQYSPDDDIEELSTSLLNSFCMKSGSHASTLERLYAWERKQCDEVKQSVKIRKEYDLKCKMLRHQESRGETALNIDKTRAIVKDLHSRIQVAIQRIYSISKRIEELRDKELQPQLKELIEGSTKMWRTMLNCHKHQYDIISSACNNRNIKVSASLERQHQVTVLLEFELNSLCSNFTKWISAHKSYLNTINSWLLKCIIPVRRQKSSRKRQAPTFSPRRDIAPPIFVTCRDWLNLLNDLPTTEVTDSIKDLVALLNHFLPHQDKGHVSSKTSFAMLRKEGRKDVMTDNFLTTESNVNCSINYDSLQSGLVVFLDRLKTFADSAVVKYEELKLSVYTAYTIYETSNKNRPVLSVV